MRHKAALAFLILVIPPALAGPKTEACLDVSGNRQVAIDLCKPLIDTAEPGTTAREKAQVLRRYAIEAFGRNDADKALEYYNRSAEADPTYHAVYNSRAQAYVRRGKYKEAEADLRKAAALKKGYVDPWVNLASMKLELKDWEGARESAAKAADLAPDDRDAFEYLATALDKLDKKDDALEAWRTAHKNNPHSANMRDKLCAALLYKAVKTGKGSPETTIALMSEGLDIDPDNTEILYARGLFYQEVIVDLPKAIADYDRFIALSPNNGNAYFNRGNARRNLKQYEAALADFDLAVRLQPDVSANYNNRGLVWQGTRDYDKAIADHLKALELDPENTNAMNNVARAYSETRQYEKAIEWSSKSIKAEPGKWMGYVNRGAAYHNSRQYAKAAADYEAALGKCDDARWKKVISGYLAGARRKLN